MIDGHLSLVDSKDSLFSGQVLYRNKSLILKVLTQAMIIRVHVLNIK
jgi:hypothetical protein